MADITVIVSACGVILALLTFVVMSHRYQTDKIDTTKEQFRTELRALAESESKRRHDLGNNVHAKLGTMELNLNRLEREAVRRDELSAMEGRINLVFDKLFAKLDMVTDRMAAVPMLEKQVAAVETKLDRLLESRAPAE